jgi:hypothetical protein
MVSTFLHIALVIEDSWRWIQKGFVAPAASILRLVDGRPGEREIHSSICGVLGRWIVESI